jgi:SAM-dependent methyltransferase
VISPDRWRRAQAYEQGYWAAVAERVAAGSYDQIGFYEWRAGQLLERLEAAGAQRLVAGEGRVVEIGSGPVGVVGFLPAVVKVAVDPLNGFYATNPKLTELRKPDVHYIEAPGERVPLDSGAYDLVIIENCIDHVHDVHGVMREIRRLLAEDGILYITVNGRSRIGYWIHRLLAWLALDPGHPHTFTAPRFRALLDSYGFEVLQFDEASWQEAWIQDLRSTQTRARLKALLFVSENLLTAVARKVALGGTR